MRMRLHGARSVLMGCCVALGLGLAGCQGPPVATDIPPVGEPRPHANVLKEREAGPIVVLFPGRSAPTDDPNLGILQTAEAIADRLDGSVGLFNYHAYDVAKRWVERQVRVRRANGGRCRLALVGHSWGAAAAGRLIEELFAADAIDEVSMLVTIDAIEPGYMWVFFGHIPSVFSLEILFPHRLRVLSLTDLPAPDGERFREHTNYYQIDSPHLSGDAIPTASHNHEVWFDRGAELGHGNLDNYISFLVVEDVIRSMEGR